MFKMDKAGQVDQAVVGHGGGVQIEKLQMLEGGQRAQPGVGDRGGVEFGEFEVG